MGCGCGKKTVRTGSNQPPTVNRIVSPRIGSDRTEAAKVYQSATLNQSVQAAAKKVIRKVV